MGKKRRRCYCPTCKGARRLTLPEIDEHTYTFVKAIIDSPLPGCEGNGVGPPVRTSVDNDSREGDGDTGVSTKDNGPKNSGDDQEEVEGGCEGAPVEKNIIGDGIIGEDIEEEAIEEEAIEEEAIEEEATEEEEILEEEIIEEGTARMDYRLPDVNIDPVCDERAKRVSNELQRLGRAIFGLAFGGAKKAFRIPSLDAIIREVIAQEGVSSDIRRGSVAPLEGLPPGNGLAFMVAQFQAQATNHRVLSRLRSMHTSYPMAESRLVHEIAKAELWATSRNSSEKMLTQNLKLNLAAPLPPTLSASLPQLMKNLREFAGMADKEVLFVRCAKGCELLTTRSCECHSCGCKESKTIPYNTVTGYLRSLFHDPVLREQLIDGTNDPPAGTDVYGSERLAYLREHAGLKERDVVFLLCCDGVTMGNRFSIGKRSAWTIVLINLSLPSAIRYRKEYQHCVFVAGGQESASDICSFLVPLVLEFSLLSTIGVPVYDSRTRQQEQVRAFIFTISADLQALAKMLCLCGPCGHSGCPVCTQLATISSTSKGGARRTYSAQDRAPIRSHTYMINLLLSGQPNNPKISGVKCVSPLLFLPFMSPDLPLLAVDMMHFAGLNMYRSLRDFLTKDTDDHQALLNRDQQIIVQQRLQQISFPRGFLAHDTRRNENWLLNHKSLTAEEGLKIMSVLGPWLFFGLLDPADYYLWVLWCITLRDLCAVCISKEQADLASQRLERFYREVETRWSPLVLRPNFHTGVRHIADMVKWFGPPRATWLFSLERFQGVLKGSISTMVRSDSAITSAATKQSLLTLIGHIKRQYPHPPLPYINIPCRTAQATVVQRRHGFFGRVEFHDRHHDLRETCIELLLERGVLKRDCDLSEGINFELFKEYAAVSLDDDAPYNDKVVTQKWHLQNPHITTFTSWEYYTGKSRTLANSDHYVLVHWLDGDGDTQGRIPCVGCVHVYVVVTLASDVTNEGTSIVYPLVLMEMSALHDTSSLAQCERLFLGRLSENPQRSFDEASSLGVNAVPMSVVIPPGRSVLLAIDEVEWTRKLLTASMQHPSGDAIFVMIPTLSSK